MGVIVIESTIKEKIEMYQVIEWMLIKEKDKAISMNRFKAINEILSDIRSKERVLMSEYDLMEEK